MDNPDPPTAYVIIKKEACIGSERPPRCIIDAGELRAPYNHRQPSGPYSPSKSEATYGNIDNTHTRNDEPEILDYIFHKGISENVITSTTSYDIVENKFRCTDTNPDRDPNQEPNRCTSLLCRAYNPAATWYEPLSDESISDHSPLLATIHVNY